MNYFKLILSLIVVSSMIIVASEDSNTSNTSAIDTNLSELIIDSGEGVMNNQHTEQP